MKLTALVLWVGSVCAFLASLAFMGTDHRTLSWLTFAIGMLAAPTGLIIYCIGQATELVLDRIDQRSRALATTERDTKALI